MIFYEFSCCDDQPCFSFFLLLRAAGRGEYSFDLLDYFAFDAQTKKKSPEKEQEEKGTENNFRNNSFSSFIFVKDLSFM